MEKYFEEWNGMKFPVREVELPEELGGFDVNVADYELWVAIKHAYDVKFHPNHKDAVELDNSIYYYCDSGFISSDPTDEEVIEYLIENVC